MKRILRILGYLLLSLLVLVIIGLAWLFIAASNKSKANLAQLGPEAKTLQQDGLSFRDLNKNGRLDIYEDRRQNVEARVADLLGQMTLEEKRA